MRPNKPKRPRQLKRFNSGWGALKRNPMAEAILRFLVGILFAAGLFYLGYTGWFLIRRWNFYWGYQSLVEKQIRNIVKDSCLK